jgi:hypothetical protein
MLLKRQLELNSELNMDKENVEVKVEDENKIDEMDECRI